MIREALARLAAGQDLTEVEMMQVMKEMTEGQATSAQIGAFLFGLRIKGESVDEIVGATKVVRSKGPLVPIGTSDVCLDRDEINVDQETLSETSASGLDGTRTFNVSTTTAFVVAGAGLRVAKHGYRYASSRWGSADVLEALGLPLDLTPGQVRDCLDQVGIGFLYSNPLDGFMGHVFDPRREIGLRTIFNHVGPLVNPAGAPVQVLGVYKEHFTEILAQAIIKLGCQNGMVFCGQDTYDELSITGNSRVTRLRDGEIETYSMAPEDIGLKRAKPGEIVGGNAAQNAAITRAILGGERGARRDMVLLNAAAVIYAAGKAETMEVGIAVAAESIDSGRSLEKLDKLVALGKYKAVPPETPSGWGWGSR
ncbi:MAG: anthranilate phosphoribosyltransferase [Desulfomonile tiedjei]|nr:anthranilate phosphoribosyltransferase [Desulfomonile tiedjei]